MAGCEEPHLLSLVFEFSKELGNSPVAFLCEGSRAEGLGHIYRALFIASDLRKKGIKTFFGRGGLNRSRIVVIDFPENERLRPILSEIPSDRVRIVFDNKGDFNGEVEVLVYPDFMPLENSPARYEYALTGWDYVYPPSSIRALKGIPPSGKDVLITFGGSDPRRYTKRALSILRDIAPSIKAKFHLVFGPLNPDYFSLERTTLPENVSIYRSLSDLSPLYKRSFIVVSSGGLSFAYAVFLNRITIGVPQNESEALRVKRYSSVSDFVRFALSPEEAIEKVGVILEGSKCG